MSVAKFADQLLDVFLQPFALVIENQSRAGRGPCLGDRPGDAALVRDAENDAGFACENLFLHTKVLKRPMLRTRSRDDGKRRTTFPTTHRERVGLIGETPLAFSESM